MIVIRLARGTAEQHDRRWKEQPRGNLTMVTDRPELRFHDGITPGGMVIPVPPEVYAAMREFYPAPPKTAPQEDIQ